MSKVYKMTIAGCERELPLCEVNEHLDIAAFIMFSDVEITVACAKELLKVCPEFDYILTAESKGIPLAYEMARQSGKNYFPARKSVKLYMTDPISNTVKSITTASQQTLFLDKKDADILKGSKVLLVDDVISMGGSMLALKALAEAAGAEVVGQATVLAEGEAADRKDIIYLEKLPVFPK